MRRILVAALTLAAVTTVPASPSPAAPDEGGGCPEPVVADGYDETERWVRVTLTATGCPPRENRRLRWISSSTPRCIVGEFSPDTLI